MCVARQVRTEDSEQEGESWYSIQRTESAEKQEERCADQEKEGEDDV